MLQRVAFREEGADVRALVDAEGGHDQPQDRDQPEGSQHGENHMATDEARSLRRGNVMLVMNVLTHWKLSSLSPLTMLLKATSVRIAQTTKTRIPMTDAIL